MAKAAVDDEGGKERSVFTPARIITFLAVATLIVVGLRALPIDQERAFALTVAQVAADHIIEPLVEGHIDAHGLEDDVVRVRLEVDAGQVVEAELLKTARRLGVEVDPDPGLPLMSFALVQEGDFALVTGTLDGAESQSGARRIGDWRSILPPLFAILVALFFRQLLVAMLGGIFLGALLHFESGLFGNLWAGTERYLWGNLTDEFNLEILAFTVALVGMILVATRAGGSQGLIDLVGRFADSARSTRVATALMGLVIFFDDYANAIVVGTTVRPMSDKRRISREKLAYLVDSTAAPVAGIAVISTWIAFELGMLQPLIDQLGLQLEPGLPTNAYSMFLVMLPLRFYCLLTLMFVFTNAWTGRDFGPMLKAERRAFETGQVLGPGAKPLTSRAMSEIVAEPGIPCRWYNIIIPVTIVVLSVLVGMLWSGKAAVLAEGLEFNLGSLDTWKVAFGGAASGRVLLVAALVGSVVAIALAVGQRLLGMGQAVHAWFQSIPAMALAFGILICAWAIRTVCDDLGTNVFLISTVGDTIPPLLFPLFTFLLSAAVAFATGTSWGTMGILLPVVVPWSFSMVEAGDGGMLIVILTAAAVLDGAIMGDHCSPISDTTVLSSIATSCDHVDHVRTQLPYALTGMVLAAAAYLGVSYGAPVWVAYGLGLLAIIAILQWVGRPSRA